MRKLPWWLLFGGCSTPIFASNIGAHQDPITPVILGVTTLFFFALLGRYIAKRLHQPGVLGELLMGVLLGNLGYYFGSDFIYLLREGAALFNIMKELLEGFTLNQAVHHSIINPLYATQVSHALSSPHGIDYLKIAYTLDIFSRYGVIFLLFMVGLESSVEELKHTGWSSFLVAVVGVIAPMILGFGVVYYLMPGVNYQSNLFIAATLSATSIGITARVLSEMNTLRTSEARTILGAAMIDDILGLILLAVVSSMVIHGTVNGLLLVQITVYSLVFFIGLVWLGPRILPRLIHYFRFLEPWESKLCISFLLIMSLAWLASIIQLSPIIGAFAAGVILHENYFPPCEASQHTASVTSKKRSKSELSINHLISPLEFILAPMFFIIIGIQVKLETFLSWNVIILSSGLIVAAILGKLISGLGAPSKQDRLLVGIGMLPRGEVGLVFASIGRTLGVISDDLFSAIVLMVMVTTFLAPPLLKARYASQRTLKYDH